MKKRKSFVALGLVLILLLLVMGCSSKGVDDSWNEAPGAPDYDYGDVPSRDGEDSKYSPELGTDPGAIGGRYFIKTGEVAVDVENLKESETKVRQFVEAKGGFISGTNSYTDPRGESQTSYMTLRVPQAHFQATMDFLKEELGKSTHSSTGDSDVTLQYVDMEARINNLTRQEARYTEILEKAETVEEILQIERELVRIRGDIESLTAQFIHLRDMVNFSTISITLRQTVLATPGVTAVGFKGAWQRALTALTESVNTLINGAANFFVYSFRILPFVILFLGGMFLVFKFLKKFDRRSSGPQQ
jgi:hypothetical protein